MVCNWKKRKYCPVRFRNRIFFYIRKTRYDLPEGEEYDQWKKQLPEWLVTKKLNIPDMVKEQQKAVNSEE